MLEIPLTLSIEEMIQKLEECKLKEGRKEAIFLLCSSLCQNHFPKDLILFMLERALEVVLHEPVEGLQVL